MNSYRWKFACSIVLFLGSMLYADDRSTTIEKWADPGLKVTQGLEFWLDGSRTAGKKPVNTNTKIATWLDASGRNQNPGQSADDSRPTLLKAGNIGVVRFDGENDFLRFVQPTTDRDRLTIFVVASPRRNPGGFLGLMAFNEADKKDYESGLTIDLGPMASPRFSSLNVEGRGFGGWKNLLSGDRKFGELSVFELSMDSAKIQMHVDGKLTGERPRDGRPLNIAELTLGARFLNHTVGEKQKVQCFGPWDIAEVLVYGRSLTPVETEQTRQYLTSRYAAIRTALPPDDKGNLAWPEPEKDAPPIQTLLPGFSVQELPVDLTNMNGVLYRPDGTLMALGYDGRIWTLRDTNGDGLEETATIFWDGKGDIRSPIGMDLTPPGYPHGDGVFIVEKTRCLLIVDMNGDSKADRTTVIARWNDREHSVGGLGIAYDKSDGSIYFGRGTTDYTNAHVVDAKGNSQYKLDSEDGTILRIAPDFKSRAIIATGIRFPVALRFNRLGDLFATEQEGATWMPNGNPFDELLMIEKGRHYGFPPRHPKHLPNVINEPSVFDYGPQHQSTCGMNFNEPVVAGGPTFGPKNWAGDALVTGESRGKIYRTKLVKTETGYVAQNQIFACLRMLTVDCCVAPDGSLVVACHSGGPDWGSGPTGKGKIFKIKYNDPNHPQPLFAWANGSREVRVEFDRPVDPSLLRDALKKTTVAAGEFVRAGDRFETIWPGYAVVQAQKVAHREAVPVRSLQLTPDRRTVVMAVDPIIAGVHYALTMPGMGRPERDPKKGLEQFPEISLDFSLSGCEATWTPDGGGDSWRGWLPHPDLNVSRAFTQGSATHEQLWQAMQNAGKLVLKTRMDLALMLNPAIQPGSKIDYEYAPETVRVKFQSNAPISIKSPVGASEDGNSAEFQFVNNQPATPQVEIEIKKPAGDIALNVSFNTNEDSRERALPLRRFYLPWSVAINEKDRADKLRTAATDIPEIEGGNWARGRAIFNSEKANCSACHSIHAKGGRVGPDLSNLVHRDYASVLRDISQPSYAINPDHIAYRMDLKDGQVMTGVLRTDGDFYLIGDNTGKETRIAKSEIERLEPSTISLMPDDVAKKLSADEMRDLMTFLLKKPPSMPEYGPAEPPQARKRSEVEAVLAGVPVAAQPARKIKIVLVSGKKDHGPGEHDYPAWKKVWSEMLSADDLVEVESADEWPTSNQIATAQVLVFFQRGSWNAEKAATMDGYFKRGGGAVYLHYAVDGGNDPEGFAERIGLASRSTSLKYRHGHLKLNFNKASNHPVIRNFDQVEFHDESYWEMLGNPKNIEILATGKEDNADQPLIWARNQEKGRVVVSILGHYSWTFDDPLFRILILRSIAWSAGEPVDRFNDLVMPGARVTE